MALSERHRNLDINIKIERFKQKIKSKELAKLINTSCGNISLIEHGLKNPSFFHNIRYCKCS